jgi:hypothetical protein
MRNELSNVTISKPKGPVTLNDAALDHVSGGWANGGGVLTAMTKVQKAPPSGWSQVLNNSPPSGVNPGLGQDTSPS